MQLVEFILNYLVEHLYIVVFDHNTQQIDSLSLGVDTYYIFTLIFALW